MSRKKLPRMKYCPKCDRLLQAELEFCSNKNKRDGRAGYCKSCMSDLQKLNLTRKKEIRHIKAAKDPMFMIRFKVKMSSKSPKRKKSPDYLGCTTLPEDILPFWNGECNSCSRKINLISKSVKEKNGGAFLDHCHKTGHFRGFLCSWCNFVIGHAKDDIEILKKCIAFLERHNERHPPTRTGVLPTSTKKKIKILPKHRAQT